MSTWAQVEHVEEAWRTFAPREIEHVQHALNRAEREVARHVDVAGRIVAGRTTAPDVRDAVVDMVVRLLRNPGAIRSQSTGPFSQVIDAQTASGRIEVTRAERRKLGMATGAQSVAVVDPALGKGRAYRLTSSGWVPAGLIP